MRKVVIFAVFFSMLMIFSTVGGLNLSHEVDDYEIEIINNSTDLSGKEIDDIGWFTSLAFDSNDYPHISFYDYGNGDLKYGFWTGSSWVFRTVDSDGDVGRYTSLVLDDNDGSHISYYDSSNGDLKYAYSSGDTWDITTIDFLGKVGLYTSIALDSSGFPHISYCDYSNKALKYAHWNGNRWDKSMVDNSGDICVFEYFGDTTSIAIDGSGTPHISYCDYGNYNLMYAVREGILWSTEVVDDIGEVGHYSSLVLDEEGDPHIGYDYLTRGSSMKFDLKYAKKTQGSWDLEVVDEESDVRKWISLKLDSSGLPHMCYYDYTEGSLKYTMYNGGTWVFDTVEIEGSTGCFNCLGLNDDIPCISYYDWGNKALKYAVFVDDNWDIETLMIDTNTDFLDQEQNYCCGYAILVSDTRPYAQSFVPDYKVLTRVELMLVKRYSPPGGLTVSIRDDLDGSDLTSITLSPGDVAEDLSWKHFDFPDLEVTTGETYYIVCSPIEIDDVQAYYWYYGMDDSYSLGMGWYKSSSWKEFSASGFTDPDFGFKTYGLRTNIPSIPDISGRQKGKVGETFDYELLAFDEDNEELAYVVDFGDGIINEYGPYQSGETCTVSHKWSTKGDYTIKAKAVDINGAESDWGTFSVSMPKSLIFNRISLRLVDFFQQFF